MAAHKAGVGRIEGSNKLCQSTSMSVQNVMRGSSTAVRLPARQATLQISFETGEPKYELKVD
jgi:hypothetical protein